MVEKGRSLSTNSFLNKSNKNLTKNSYKEVHEYKTEILSFLLRTEQVNKPTPYLSETTTPKMRIILLDWIIDVHLKFKLFP